MHCPDCYSQHLVKNGFNALGKQMYLCKACGRQFVLDPAKTAIFDEKKKLIDDLLLERISLAGIARVLKISERWFQDYVNTKYDQTPREVQVKEKRKGRLTLECDELSAIPGQKIRQ